MLEGVSSGDLQDLCSLIVLSYWRYMLTDVAFLSVQSTAVMFFSGSLLIKTHLFLISSQDVS